MPLVDSTLPDATRRVGRWYKFMPQRTNGQVANVGQLRFPVKVTHATPSTPAEIEAAARRSEDNLQHGRYLKGVFMPRTTHETLASTGRDSFAVKFITKAADIVANAEWLADAKAGRLELVIGEDFTVNGHNDPDDLLDLSPIAAFTMMQAVANKFKRRLETALPGHKVTVSIVARPDDASENDWTEYELQRTPTDEGGRAKKETKAQRRDIGSMYVYVLPQS